LLRMNENLSSEEKSRMNIDSNALSYALLISNVSVLLIGLILIGRAFCNTSEGDFLDVGFDEHYDEYGRDGVDDVSKFNFAKDKSTSKGKVEHLGDSELSKSLVKDDNIMIDNLVVVLKNKTEEKTKTPNTNIQTKKKKRHRRKKNEGNNQHKKIEI